VKQVADDSKKVIQPTDQKLAKLREFDQKMQDSER
jgi:hypothetical protein